MGKSPKFRLMSKRIISERGCWLWTGHCDKRGYGRISYNGEAERVHILSAILFLNFDKKSELYICHSCDITNCFNPDHLFIGTQRENVADAMRKGIFPVGSRHGSAKLSETEVLEIRQALTENETWASIADRYGVSIGCVQKIAHLKSWKEI